MEQRVQSYIEKSERMPKSQYNFSFSMGENHRLKAEIERLNGGTGSMDISSNHMFQHETHDNIEIKNELENLE